MLIKDPDKITASIANSLKPGGRYLIAVSAGLDSMSLLHALISLKDEQSYSLHVAHFNHMLRSEAADEQEFVKNYCTKARIPFTAGQAENPPSKNIEAWARKERYTFLRELRASLKFDKILTAHNANDQAETLLLKLFSNRDLRLIDAECEKRNLSRPLLNVTRAALEGYAKNNSVPYIEDSSNEDLRFERNKIRKKVIPFIQEELNRGDIVEVLHSQSQKLEKIYAQLDLETEKDIEKISKHEFGSKDWLKETRKALSKEKGSKQELIVAELYFNEFKRRLGTKHSRLLTSFFLGNSAQIELPGSLRLYRSNGAIMSQTT